MSERKLLEFDLTRVEIPVKIAGENYTLKEADGEAATKWRNSLTNGMIMGADGKPQRIQNIANVEPLLVSLCLYDSNDRRVPEKVIRSWPSRVVKALYDEAKRISHLADEELDEDELDKADREEHLGN